MEDVRFVRDYEDDIGGDDYYVCEPFIDVVLGRAAMVCFVVSDYGVDFTRLGRDVHSVCVFLRRCAFNVIFDDYDFVVADGAAGVLLEVVILRVMRRVEDHGICGEIFLFCVYSIRVDVFRLVFCTFDLFGRPLGTVDQVISEGGMEADAFMDRMRLFGHCQADAIRCRFDLLTRLYVYRYRRAFTFDYQDRFSGLVFPIAGVNRIREAYGGAYGDDAYTRYDDASYVFTDLIDLVRTSDRDRIYFAIFRFRIASAGDEGGPLDRQDVCVCVFQDYCNYTRYDDAVDQSRVFTVREDDDDDIDQLDSRRESIMSDDVIYFRCIDDDDPDITYYRDRERFINIARAGDHSVDLSAAYDREMDACGRI